MDFSRPLRNSGFRWFLLLVAGVPLIVDHLFLTLILPLISRSEKLADFYVYLDGARALVNGQDIYASYFHSSIPDSTLNQTYIYPPLLAWLLQPLTFIDLHWAGVIGILIGQASLVVFVVLIGKALHMRGLQAYFALLLLSITFFPVRQNLYGAQINLALLALASIWFWAHLQKGRWWGGLALGLAVAIKPIQAPYFLLPLLRRQYFLIVTAIATGLTLWLLALPQFLFEYWFKVFPSLASSTGFRENVAIAGTLERLFHPASYYGQFTSPAMLVKPLSLVCSLLIISATFWTLHRRPKANPTMEASLIIAMTPLVVNLVWPSHLVFLLIPIAVLADRAIRSNNWHLGLMTSSVWFLIGLVKALTLTLISEGVQNPWVLRPLAETTLLGMLILYVLCLHQIWQKPNPSKDQTA